MPMSSPEAPSKLEIEVAPATAAEDERVVAEMTDLINRVYTTAEAGLWVDGAARTTTTEIAEMIAADQIALARVDGQIVGSIRIQQLDHGVGEFGMLVADPAHRSKGVGSEPIRFAEELSRRRGLTVMQFELLVPRGWSHPTKEYLHAWYTRIGYRPVRTGGVEEMYPHLAPLLATPCDFVVYHKPLIAPIGGRA
jgi:GNAT superfamily N-acetyltransferase